MSLRPLLFSNKLFATLTMVPARLPINFDPSFKGGGGGEEFLLTKKGGEEFSNVQTFPITRKILTAPLMAYLRTESSIFKMS